MAEGDTILRLARRLDSALAGGKVSATAPNPRGREAGVERLDYAPGAPWRRRRAAAWAILRGGGHEAVQFSGPTMRVLPIRRLRRDPQLARLGPDILAPDFDPGEVAAAMRAEPERSIGAALLDQRLVAGIGNIFRSEACFGAGIDPRRPVGALSGEELLAVLHSARERMLHAVASGRDRPAIYRRRGPCPRCGGTIASDGLGDANRTAYWCPSCQA